ncbi:MAG: signal peptidase I [Kiritimatiellia bacterium]
MDRKTYPKWTGVILGFLLSGSAHYLSGKKSVGIQWYLAITLSEIAGIMILALPGITGFVLSGIMLLSSFALWLAMLAKSYRPVQRIRARGWLAVIALSILLPSIWAHAVQQVVRPFKVSSGAMIPSILPGDHIMAERLTYRFVAPRRGDIVVFSTRELHYPYVQTNTFYVKRIAGLPGETIQIDPPNLIVNGKAIREPPIFAEISSRSNGFQLALGAIDAKPVLHKPADRIVLGDNEYLTLGDNTASSLDGRYYGPVAGDQIIGRVVRTYWPMSRMLKQ